MKHCPQCSTGYPDTLAACPTHGLPLNEIRDLKPGMVVHHSYRIVRKLGQGGMGAVYLAQHTLMDEPRALKFLSAELSQDAAFTARFLREVRTLRQIRHCNVVDCGDLESAEDGSLFFSMEFVDGPDLRAFLRDSSQYLDNNNYSQQFIDDCHPERSAAESKDLRLYSADERVALKGHDFSRAINEPNKVPALAAEGSSSSATPKSPGFSASPAGALPVPLALDLTRQIAVGLAAAHARGMVHRDIKPENILLARDATGWQPKIADFGIVATKEASTAFTRTGGTLLTVAYAAPEQWRGTPAAQLDGRTDLYALGGLLYEMLTGQTPFHAESYEGWAQAHQTTPPPPPSALRPDLADWQGLDAIVQRLLAKDREDRPKDVAELLGLLDMIGRAIPAPDSRLMSHATVIETLPSQSPQSLLKRFRKWVVGILIAFTIAGLLMFWLVKTERLTEPRKYIGIWMAEHRGTQGPDYVTIEKFADGFDAEYRYAEAVPLYDQACKVGYAHSCTQLGLSYRNGDGVAVDKSRAATLYSKACDANDPLGCMLLGDMYENGDGITKDYSRAAMLFSKSCDAGYHLGCYGFATIYMEGIGVAKDKSRAAAIYSSACDRGELASCGSLAKMYEAGEGIIKDNSRAAMLYSKGCDAEFENEESCTNIGRMYVVGRGVQKNATLAVAFFRKGCDSGILTDACLYLGDSYRLGYGVEKDTEKANQIFSKWCNMGLQKACDQLTGGDILKQIR